MHPAQLIDALSRPDAYPYPLDRVAVKQTHISIVFLSGPCVYKVKKSVRLGFLDGIAGLNYARMRSTYEGMVSVKMSVFRHLRRHRKSGPGV